MMRAIATIFLAMLFCSVPRAQEAAPQISMDRLAGGWRYVTTYVSLPDGTTTDQFGKAPAGLFIILPNGICSHIIMRPDLQPVKSGLIKQTMPEEREALAEGTLAWFGRCKITPGGGSFLAEIEKSSFPNFDGETQVREIVELTHDTLRYVNSLTTAGEGSKVHAQLRRVW